MSKEVKVFSGSASTPTGTATTIYTVPVGRVAKIEMSSIKCSGSTNIGFSIGAYVQSFSTPDAVIFQFPKHYGANITAIGNNILMLGSYKYGAGPEISFGFIHEFYLIAGDTFKIDNTNGAGSLTSSYDFLVIEEF